jgi:hypothetical protein
LEVFSFGRGDRKLIIFLKWDKRQSSCITPP